MPERLGRDSRRTPDGTAVYPAGQEVQVPLGKARRDVRPGGKTRLGGWKRARQLGGPVGCDRAVMLLPAVSSSEDRQGQEGSHPGGRSDARAERSGRCKQMARIRDETSVWARSRADWYWRRNVCKCHSTGRIDAHL